MSESYEDEQNKLYQEIERDVLRGLETRVNEKYLMKPATFAVAITWQNGTQIETTLETFKARGVSEALGQSIQNRFKNNEDKGVMVCYNVRLVK